MTRKWLHVLQSEIVSSTLHSVINLIRKVLSISGGDECRTKFKSSFHALLRLKAAVPGALISNSATSTIGVNKLCEFSNLSFFHLYDNSCGSVVLLPIIEKKNGNCTLNCLTKNLFFAARQLGNSFMDYFLVALSIASYDL